MSSWRKGLKKVNAELLFGVFVFLLNFLVFFPIYYFFAFRTSFYPSVEISTLTAKEILQRFLFERSNLDIFRFQLEWFLFVCAWVWVGSLRKRRFLVFGFMIYLVLLIYHIYEGFVRTFYLLEPVFYNDFFLFSDLTQYVIGNLNYSWLRMTTAVGGTLLLIYLFYRLLSFIFLSKNLRTFSPFSRIFYLSICLAFCLPLFIVRQDLSQPASAVSSFSAKINQNILFSQEAKVNSDRFDRQRIADTLNFSSYALIEKPDIHLIFVESYGSVLYKRADFLIQTMATMSRLDDSLENAGWFMASNRSEAPTWGGGSWMSYTSALSGVRIETHAEYLSLLNQYHNEPYPHLVNYLRSQGYKSYRLSSISKELDDLIWQRYKSFYGFDEWLRFGDIDYEGPLYGWGPSPPDQYALNFAHEYINKAAEQAPYIFFYISQNSHYPWTPLPEIAVDWQSLNQTAVEPQASEQSLTQRVLRTNYVKSIDYEMTTIVDYIIQQGDENDIFVLIGDHQPARVARRADGFDTPIHIISQNQAFVESFFDYQFVPTMKTGGVEPALHHEGFYSLFVQILLISFGDNSLTLPIYQPNGLFLD